MSKHSKRTTPKYGDLLSTDDRLSADNSLKRETAVVQAFLENMANWLLLYLHSKHPSALTHLPKTPSLKALRPLGAACDSLRDTAVKLKEANKVQF